MVGKDSREYPARPLVGVGVVVVQRGRVLLVRRANPPRQGEWSLPGGLQRLGETVFAAAEREVGEETGIRVRILGLVDVVDLIERDGRGRVRYHYTLIDLLAAWSGGEAVAAADAADLAWADPEALSRFRLWSESERIIRLAHRQWLAGGAP